MADKSFITLSGRCDLLRSRFEENSRLSKLQSEYKTECLKAVDERYTTVAFVPVFIPINISCNEESFQFYSSCVNHY